jgi:hypothetical protein
VATREIKAAKVGPSLEENIAAVKSKLTSGSGARSPEDPEKRIMADFKARVGETVVKYLKPHLEKTAEYGYIPKKDDFKYLARKVRRGRGMCGGA